jgi:hypothetical protein
MTPLLDRLSHRATASAGATSQPGGTWCSVF